MWTRLHTHQLVFGSCGLAGLFFLSPCATAQTASEQNIEQVIVTGMRLAGPTAQDVHVYDQQRIEQSGQSTVSDFLGTLPEVSLNSVESTSIGTTVRLRGAVPGSTLVLVNGQRVESASGGVAQQGFFDLNTIPLALVKRIDVLPSGSGVT
jgi:outer membrane cobalamin receptor